MFSNQSTKDKITYCNKSSLQLVLDSLITCSVKCPSMQYGWLQCASQLLVIRAAASRYGCLSTHSTKWGCWTVHLYNCSVEPGTSLPSVEVLRVNLFWPMRGKQYNLHKPITALTFRHPLMILINKTYNVSKKKSKTTVLHSKLPKCD